mmetsp:Transcript_148555/g.413895  ORF Transcript_148555/g.413895 Transcript_148555/m.413895 type:complete len:154 (-) Transcript_148555:224-685(-)
MAEMRDKLYEKSKELVKDSKERSKEMEEAAQANRTLAEKRDELEARKKALEEAEKDLKEAAKDVEEAAADAEEEASEAAAKTREFEVNGEALERLRNKTTSSRLKVLAAEKELHEAEEDFARAGGHRERSEARRTLYCGAVACVIISALSQVA